MQPTVALPTVRLHVSAKGALPTWALPWAQSRRWGRAGAPPSRPQPAPRSSLSKLGAKDAGRVEGEQVLRLRGCSVDWGLRLQLPVANAHSPWVWLWAPCQPARGHLTLQLASVCIPHSLCSLPEAGEGAEQDRRAGGKSGPEGRTAPQPPPPAGAVLPAPCPLLFLGGSGLGPHALPHLSAPGSVNSHVCL